MIGTGGDMPEAYSTRIMGPISDKYKRLKMTQVAVCKTRAPSPVTEMAGCETTESSLAADTNRRSDPKFV